MNENKGLSVHCHHNLLIEYCTDYQGRVEFIKRKKLESEQEIRWVFIRYPNYWCNLFQGGLGYTDI